MRGILFVRLLFFSSVACIIFGSIMYYQTTTDNILTDYSEENELLTSISEGSDQENDAGIENEKEDTELIQSPITDLESFKQEFMDKSGDHSREVSPSPESEVIQGAGDLLDEAQAEDAIIDAIEMAEQLQDSDLIHPDNIVLDLDDFDERLNSLRKDLRDDEDP